MIKYAYQVVDSKGKVASYTLIQSREEARKCKRGCEEHVHLQAPLGETPPYKILRFKLINPEMVR